MITINSTIELDIKKQTVLQELTNTLYNFQLAGYEYTGDIVCPIWDSETIYIINDLVQGSDLKNYKSLVISNINNDPISNPEFWEEYTPVFKTNDKTLLNINSKNNLDNNAIDRYKYYSKSDITGFKFHINFDNSTNWDSFVIAFRTEQDRIMRKYNSYKTEINKCTTINDVNAIIIDFST